ncbi:MAG: toprim domain-containing protein [Candidatus Kaiserbacteria bacterium]|nr:toprim domain-containing protein [Candidatus Kaiserbacteria bacterium]
MDPIERLTSIFERFPGIGPRQAGRFVQFLLRSPQTLRRELASGVEGLNASVHQCSDCMRYHTGKRGACAICESPKRDSSLLAVVANDTDLLAMERSGTYRGKYFVLGGTVSLASEKMNGLRVRELIAYAPKLAKGGLKEIILAFPANPEGDFTAIRLKEDLVSIILEHSIKITSLGRGLSTGSELEYADPDTIKSALDSRR